MRFYPPLKRSAILGGLLAAAVGCAADDKPPGDAIVIGLLLPFTGNASATAPNLEQAAIYAVDRINQGGGLKGHPVRIVSRDTHSELGRSRRSVAELVAEGARVLIGPESPEIAADIAPYLAEHHVMFLSPLVGAGADPPDDCTAPWFRLAPSAKSLGEALAKQLVGAGATDAVIMHAANQYDDALSEAVARRFASLGGRVALDVQIDPNAQGYASEVARVSAASVDAVVLATSPRAGALFVSEFDVSSARVPRWFLSPVLKTELLVQNVAPEALEGALGVAPKIYDRTDDFPNAYAQRWLGDRPLEGAYFYYDAVSLFAFAFEKAAADDDGGVSSDKLEAAMLDAAAPPGEAAGWNEIEVGLSRLRDGDDMYYSGLTGPLLLAPCGSRQIGVTSTFEVTGGRIVDE